MRAVDRGQRRYQIPQLRLLQQQSDLLDPHRLQPEPDRAHPPADVALLRWPRKPSLDLVHFHHRPDEGTWTPDQLIVTDGALDNMNTHSVESKHKRAVNSPSR